MKVFQSMYVLPWTFLWMVYRGQWTDSWLFYADSFTHLSCSCVRVHFFSDGTFNFHNTSNFCTSVHEKIVIKFSTTARENYEKNVEKLCDVNSKKLEVFHVNHVFHFPREKKKRIWAEQSKRSKLFKIKIPSLTQHSFCVIENESVTSLHVFTLTWQTGGEEENTCLCSLL